MKIETEQSDGAAAKCILVRNRLASKTLPWTTSQDQILNETNFEVAKATISSWAGYAPTPLVSLPGLAREAGIGTLFYKDEAARFGLGSFKALGGAFAVAKLLKREIEARLRKPVSMQDILAKSYLGEASNLTVCCATDGNHGRSVAWGAQTFGCRCVIFIHATVSEGRKTAIEAYGAEVRRCNGNYDDSVRVAQSVATEEGWFVVSDTSYTGYMEIPKDVMQGYELMGAEAFDQLEMPPTHIFLQTGVGGMAAAVAAQAKRRWGGERPTIILADPKHAACWMESFCFGKPTVVEGELDTLMAGLACGEVSTLAWEILKDHGDAAIALTDESAIQMMRRLAYPLDKDPAIVAGESAVAGLAGLMATAADEEARDALGLGADSRVLIFGTEGDTDPELYKTLVGYSHGDGP